MFCCPLAWRQWLTVGIYLTSPYASHFPPSSSFKFPLLLQYFPLLELSKDSSTVKRGHVTEKKT